ncbi:hypothetical protein STEG23_023793, partial [Scotinomys teguina]
MYYFLSSLSFIDFCQSTVVTPKLLVTFVTEKNIIFYPGCMNQLYFFLIFAIAECYTLAAMAYDCYAAISNPLLYSDLNKNMAGRNHCTVTEFFLAGLSEKPELQMPLFLLFLGIYVITIVGNLGMITLIVLSPHLHNPMYYFLSSLSFIDFCQSTVVTPKLLVSFVTEKNLISYPGCMTQLYFFIIFAIAECYTLAAMAYDRYVAICNPLLYSVTMSYQIYTSLISVVYIFGVFCASAHIGLMTRVYFCKLDVINHYFCDLFPLLKLARSNTYINELLILFLGTLNIFVPTFTIIASYMFIIASIIRIRSTEGRSKAFSTCSSHILAVVIFFGSLAFMYLQPSSVNSMDQGKVSSVFYTIVVPMLNPLIYSLRNKDVSVALKKIFERKTFMKIKYLLVMVDSFSNWVEVYPVSNKHAQTVMDVLLREIIPRFGVPASVQSDNGPEFTSLVSQTLAKALNIPWHFHIPYRPQSKGKVEHTNQSLKSILTKMSQELHLNWKNSCSCSVTDRALLTQAPEDTRTHHLIISSRKVRYHPMGSSLINHSANCSRATAELGGIQMV